MGPLLPLCISHIIFQKLKNVYDLPKIHREIVSVVDPSKFRLLLTGIIILKYIQSVAMWFWGVRRRVIRIWAQINYITNKNNENNPRRGQSTHRPPYYICTRRYIHVLFYSQCLSSHSSDWQVVKNPSKTLQHHCSIDFNN